MATLTKGYTFGSTELVTATKLHSLIESGAVTEIANADIKASAGIVDTKLATISTAGKVALTAIPSINEDDMSSDSDEYVPTQQSVKAYASIEAIGIACSDESTDLTVVDGAAIFRMPFAFTLTGVRATVTTAPVGSEIIVDITEGGTTVLSTLLTIDVAGKSSEDATTPAVISDSALSDDAEISINIDQIGSSTAGTGLKIWLTGKRV